VSPTGIAALKNAPANLKDPGKNPAATATVLNTAAKNAGVSNSFNNSDISAVLKAKADKNATPTQQAAFDKLLQNKPLTDVDRAALNDYAGKQPPGSPFQVANAKSNINDSNNDKNGGFVNPLAGGNGGFIVPFGVLGLGGFQPDGGQNSGFILGGGDSVPPCVPCVFFPTDPPSTPFGPDDVPDGRGSVCTLLPCEYPGLVDVGGDQNSDAVQLAATGLAQAAEVLQQTRYLRVANDTDKPVTIFVQYQALNDQGAWVWSGQDDEALQFQVAPGDVIDLDDNGWRINAVSAHIWVKSDNGDEWNTFHNDMLWLVPETDENGNHVYQDQGIQIFDYAVR
jgi:hypothetical protein